MSFLRLSCKSLANILPIIPRRIETRVKATFFINQDLTKNMLVWRTMEQSLDCALVKNLYFILGFIHECQCCVNSFKTHYVNDISNYTELQEWVHEGLMRVETRFPRLSSLCINWNLNDENLETDRDLKCADGFYKSSKCYVNLFQTLLNLWRNKRIQLHFSDVKMRWMFYRWIERSNTTLKSLDWSTMNFLWFRIEPFDTRFCEQSLDHCYKFVMLNRYLNDQQSSRVSCIFCWTPMTVKYRQASFGSSSVITTVDDLSELRYFLLNTADYLRYRGLKLKYKIRQLELSNPPVLILRIDCIQFIENRELKKLFKLYEDIETQFEVKILERIPNALNPYHEEYGGYPNPQIYTVLPPFVDIEVAWQYPLVTFFCSFSSFEIENIRRYL